MLIKKKNAEFDIKDGISFGSQFLNDNLTKGCRILNIKYEPIPNTICTNPVATIIAKIFPPK